ncbi:energy transducer TonB [Taibaiella koreensis]|uniref:energy transducer TonB n=1 Tax=Taibaiella koreensis TaxID=1268548 RepID=UPI0013C2C11F|nr:energy transducer TonB [Taibaiella koreensis]
MKKSILILLVFFLPFCAIAQQQKQAPAKEPAASGPGSHDRHKEHKVYRTVQQTAEFPGGAVNLQKFLKQHFHYPPMAFKQGIEGRVILQFIVDSTGQISNVNVMKDIGGGCGNEAVRLVKAMPRWRPAKQDGKPVSSYYSLPVSFSKSNVDTTAINR